MQEDNLLNRTVKHGVRTTDEELEDIVLKYYGQLFTSSQPSNLADIMSTVPKVVTEDMNADLVKDITIYG